MPTPVAIEKSDVVKLRQFRTFTDADVVLWGLLLGKTAGNATQVVNATTFLTEWGIDDDRLSRELAALERQKIIKQDVAPFTITWNVMPTTSMTEEQLRADWNAGVIDDYTTYVYYALVFGKGATPNQTVDPAQYLANWQIPQTNLIQEVNNLAAKDNPRFTVNYPSISITWLETVGNA
ncbi:hypothetical protein IQ258_28945 [Coleofasciculus sp. LEGE 07081]|uniref:hypothetical protein n=1 Tax=Coleofasciculus sp. LEGE 07081 TaxID=2777967 RepID=UPI001882AE43|nr:hypothetical protein [Coleofasciculus sp. LEGE 07081]MBE9130052.1 hypothetical protein [Coleofasciculus sp. LEGE 07081]